MAWNDLLKIRTWSLDGSRTEHITDAVKSRTWSGSYKDCCRQLAFEALPEALCELGGRVRFYHGADVLFSGSVFERGRDTLQPYLSCVAYDRGIYLKRNSVYRAVRAQTPEAVTRQLCGEFSIPCGALAATGVTLSRNFMGTSLYQVIQTLYSLASEQTGEKYQIRFAGDALTVAVKSRGAASLRLMPGNNLISCAARDSIADMVTSVGVYSDKAVRTATYRSPDNFAALYGLMEKAVKASSFDDPAAEARQILRDNGLATTITAECIGNPRLISGNAVAVHEPVTGCDGLFWILTDSHTVARGVYKTRVTLDFRNLMDAQSAGSVPTK